MQEISVSLTAMVFLALIALLVAAVAVPVEIVNTLQNVDAVPPSGKIVGIQDLPYLSFATYEAAEDWRFRFTRDSEGTLVIHAVNRSRFPTERVSNAVTTRVVVVNLTPPFGRSMQVRVVDAEGNAIRQRAGTSASH